ncbi:MAG: flagellar export protein FliJ [Betaproteobacteria bacterium]|nr:flagellar export protein FliJ [Betaproteobacteria bacterium]
MTAPSPLSLLIELAHKETDDAAAQLGLALRAGDEAAQKLDLLLQYRDDYAARCQNSLSEGISTTHLHNFQVFMQKLDQAIAGQQRVVSDARLRIAQARSVWQACEQKKMSFVTLAQRADKEQSRRELLRDQKQNDEHAARRALHKLSSS